MGYRETIGLPGAAAARPWLAAAMLAFTAASAQAQASAGDNEAKIARCRDNSTELIFLDRAALRTRCGLWSRASTTKTARGERERIVYNRYFVVYLDNGVVSSVRKRRQIFTGFKARQ